MDFRLLSLQLLKEQCATRHDTSKPVKYQDKAGLEDTELRCLSLGIWVDVWAESVLCRVSQFQLDMSAATFESPQTARTAVAGFSLRQR